MQKPKEYDTLGEISVEEFVNKFKIAKEEFSNLNRKLKNKHRFTVVSEDGKEYSLKTKSLRYHVFYENLDCVECGAVGSYFLMQKTKEKDEKPHANLYAENGELMTKDHILRKSEGGKDHIENLQTMCFTCNCIDKR